VDTYQAATFPTPAFPDYVSGHSTHSAAAARILQLWTGSDRFGDSVTLSAGSSKIEPEVTPHKAVTLQWNTFTERRMKPACRGGMGEFISGEPTLPDDSWAAWLRCKRGRKLRPSSMARHSLRPVLSWGRWLAWRPKYRKTSERNPVRGTGSAIVLTSLSFVWEIVPCASG